ncbi:MAG TPA: MotA/TolQ/ExbB proton channel family protein [Pseudomonadota bacterium]|jgi:biopolymer transport protein ExbB/TolQ|nr:MotA/TolQ/ExbB proton channel family protein [Pseudomonadota bacterium]HNI58836.1 MotA/TolQ/ExbB proton channel family protein [Pseudomonadota bacterium]HNK43655.1 MotA/TolQ/ExbB proton channel family protein [Pseudomonadota bacterium]HNN53098.1 MotA/TolQ/ExbB proton channel family protein [Pseudomonadota bacterium]HNO69183.1 MotA/TolQ/ExbB proton channel family protein [Pseudomonadota bacterium]
MQQLKEFFEQGGFFMYVNLLCSVVVVTLIVDRAMFFLGKGAVNARAFLEQLRKLLSAGQLEKAQRLAQSSDAPIALVAKAGLSKLKNGEAAVSTAIEEALTDATPELKKRIGVLWSLANIATLLGLLGTINGLIGGFAAIGKAAADQRSSLLATRIAEAMNNTWLGLAIAASCMIGHLFLSAASKSKQQELESFALRLENLLFDLIANPPAPAAEKESRDGGRGGSRRDAEKNRRARDVEDEEDND